MKMRQRRRLLPRRVRANIGQRWWFLTRVTFDKPMTFTSDESIELKSFDGLVWPAKSDIQTCAVEPLQSKSESAIELIAQMLKVKQELQYKVMEELIEQAEKNRRDKQ